MNTPSDSEPRIVKIEGGDYTFGANGSPYALTISGRPQSVRVSSDLSLEVGVMQRRAMAQVLSELGSGP